jgi:cell division protease FtsH
VTTGAGNDLERVTDLARKMVCEWGMSEAMGPLTFGKKEEQIFLGREINKAQDYSEETAVRIDQEVKKFVMDNYERARVVLTQHKPILQKIADELLAREVLDADQVKRIAAGQPLLEPIPAPTTTPASDDRRGSSERAPIVPSLGKPVGQE